MQNPVDLDATTHLSTFGSEIKILVSEPKLEPTPVTTPSVHIQTGHITDLTVQSKFPLTIVPFSEELEITSIFRCKNWMNTFLTATKNIYIHFSRSRNQFYWDVRRKESLRNTTLFGPFNTQEDAFKHISEYYSWGKNVIERLE